jgi:hypothetical protein
MMVMGLAIESSAIADFCGRNHIQRLALFGSILREDFRPDSDVDVLVEFEVGHVPGLIGLGTLEMDLSRLFGGRKIDLHTPASLYPGFRDRVIAEAEPLFDAQG